MCVRAIAQFFLLPSFLIVLHFTRIFRNSIINLGKIPKNAKSIIQLDLDFNTLQIFSSSVQAAKSIGKETADSTNIRRSANSGGNKIAYGFRWRWKNENS